MYHYIRQHIVISLEYIIDQIFKTILCKYANQLANIEID